LKFDVEGAGRVHAHFLWRVLACLLDFGFAIVITALISVPLGLAVGVTTAVLNLNSETGGQVASLIGYGLGAIVTVAYFAGFESSKLQATPGKMIAGLVVTDMQGRRISFGRAFVRLMLKVVSGSIFGLAYLVCLFTENKQALHDVVVNTLVWKVKRDVAKPDKPEAAVE